MTNVHPSSSDVATGTLAHLYWELLAEMIEDTRDYSQHAAFIRRLAPLVAELDRLDQAWETTYSWAEWGAET